jgi:hypothetical protein
VGPKDNEGGGQESGGAGQKVLLRVQVDDPKYIESQG